MLLHDTASPWSLASLTFRRRKLLKNSSLSTNFHWKKMKVKREVAEKGTLVNLSTTYATEKPVNGIAIIPHPQNIKNKASGQSVACHPGETQCLTEKKSTTKSLSYYPLLPSWPVGFLVPSMERWETGKKSISESHCQAARIGNYPKLPTCCILPTRWEGKMERDNNCFVGHQWSSGNWKQGTDKQGWCWSEADLSSSSEKAEMAGGDLWPSYSHDKMQFSKSHKLHCSYQKAKVKVFCWSKPLWILRLCEVNHICHGITMGAGPALEQELAWQLWNAVFYQRSRI